MSTVSTQPSLRLFMKKQWRHNFKHVGTMMQKKQLGNTDMHLTPVGFGSWAIGGADWAYGWGAQDDGDAIAAIERAVELGINWIDTAAVYGLGHSEELVGKAVAGLKQKPYIFTKCSMVWNAERQVSFSLKADSIRRECEASLKRLQVDAIDLYQIHWPNPDTDLEEGWNEMARLQEKGLVRHIGVSNFTVEQLRRITSIAPVASLQPPYSMLRPAVEKELLPFCLERNIGVIVYSPMLSGSIMPSRPAVETAKSRPRLSAAASSSSSPAPVMAVQTPWGHRHETFSPASPWVMESHSAKATVACLVTAYGAEPSWVSSPAAEAVWIR